MCIHACVVCSLRYPLTHTPTHTQSDNNVKLIVLDRLAELKGAHSKVMREVVMDVLRALSTPDLVHHHHHHQSTTSHT